MTDALADERLTAMGLFAEAYGGLTSKMSAQLAQHGLGEVDFEVLMRLVRTPGGLLRMGDLSAQTSLTTSGVTRVVDRLAQAGLVCRRACPSDRRSTFAVVTDQGREKVAQVLPGHLELIERWLTGPLTDDQRLALLEALRLVRDRVRPDATAGADGGAGVVHRSAQAAPTG
jgi:MarR family 2-MHQ and catechol resistance regulon transcriptional repressor